MTKTYYVAANTLREAVRDRILYLLLFFSLLLIASGKILSLLSIGEPTKILVDVGLSSIDLFSSMIAVFMGISLISREIDKRTIYTTVTKPLGREAFVVGKFIGMLGTIALNQAIMVLVFALTLQIFGGRFTVAYGMCILLSLVKAALLLSLAIFFSAVSSPLLASMFTLTSYAVGHWLDGILPLLDRVEGGMAKRILLVVYRLFPNLELSNLKDLVVFPDPGSLAEMNSRFTLGLWYGLAYAAAILLLGVAAYRRKDFT